MLFYPKDCWLMKKYYTEKKYRLFSSKSFRILFCLFISFIQFDSFQLYAQKGKKEKNCETSCFQTEIIEIESLGNCQKYELEVSHTGSCTFALSHFTVAVPCGTIANVSNSENWPIETDVLDPKTQLYGFKIDEIRDFGEEDAPQKFRVGFEVCPTDETCTQALRCWEPVVAYKAGQCVHYDTISADCPTKTNPLTGTLSVQNPAAAGSNDGYIHLSVEGGAGPYTFLWSNGDTTQNLEGISEGYYSVTVVDALGNQLTLDTVLIVPEPIENDSTNNNGDGNQSGGDNNSDEDTSEDNSGNTDDDPSSEGSGDDNDETEGDSNSDEDTSEDGSGNTDDDTSSGGDSGDNNGGTDNTDDNNDGADNDGNSDEDTSEDNSENADDDTGSTDESNDDSTENEDSCTDCYEMKIITQEKSGNCTYYEIEVATDGTCSTSLPQAFTGTLTTQNPSCGGGSDGYIHLSVESGTAPYSFTWSNGATTQNLEGMGAGSYSVIIEDAAGNQLTLDTTLDEPAAISLSYTVTPASCSGPSDGSIALQVQGGTAPYSFIWSDGVTTQNREYLSPGTYEVIVTDQTGCSETASITVSMGSNISIIGITTHVSCGAGNDGAIDLTVQGGTAPYTFNWINGKATEDVDNLSAGIYSVQVTDATGCTAMKSFSIKTSTSLSVSANVTRTGCTEDASGTIDLTIKGGTVPFTFSWSNGETTEDISGLTAGFYSVEISDAGGCSTSYSTYIRKEVLYFTYETVSPGCPGATDGEIHIIPPDDRDIYTYTWGTGATTQTLTGLSSGYYNVTVTDTSGCSSSRYIALEDPAPVTIDHAIVNPDCSGNLMADLDLLVSGGSAPYTFAWSTGETTEDLTGIGEGTYEVSVTDTHGCMASASIPVSISCDTTDSTDGNTEDPSEDGSGDGGDDTSSDNTGDNTDGTDTPDNNNGETDGSNEDGTGSDNEESTQPDGDENSSDDEENANNDNDAEFIVAIPCGSVSNISNSGGWIVETHIVDSITGLTGFKIDHIQGFGESQQPESFTVGFTVCSDESACQETLNCWQPVVTYKTGECIVNDTLQAACDLNSTYESARLTTYPNPIEVIDEAMVEFTLEETSFATLELYDLSGNLITTLFAGEAGQGSHLVSLEGLTLTGDIYICRLITSTGVVTQRIILPQ